MMKRRGDDPGVQQLVISVECGEGINEQTLSFVYFDLVLLKGLQPSCASSCLC